MMEKIYRDLTCSLTNENSGKLLRSLVKCGATITSMFSTGKEKPVGHFRLLFPSQQSINDFHENGFATTEPHEIAMEPTPQEDGDSVVDDEWVVIVDEGQEVDVDGALKRLKKRGYKINE